MFTEICTCRHEQYCTSPPNIITVDMAPSFTRNNQTQSGISELLFSAKPSWFACLLNNWVNSHEIIMTRWHKIQLCRTWWPGLRSMILIRDGTHIHFSSLCVLDWGNHISVNQCIYSDNIQGPIIVCKTNTSVLALEPSCIYHIYNLYKINNNHKVRHKRHITNILSVKIYFLLCGFNSFLAVLVL